MKTTPTSGVVVFGERSPGSGAVVFWEFSLGSGVFVFKDPVSDWPPQQESKTVKTFNVTE